MSLSPLAAAGLDRIEWADRGMPVLRAIRAQFAEEQPFAGLRIAACMHVTTETANLVRALLAGGAEVHLAASNPLSTQDDVVAALAEEYGAHVTARRGADPRTYAAELTALVQVGAHIVLDDGCDLVAAMHAESPELLPGLLGACEQTTSGVIRLRAMAEQGALRVPVVSVNDTATKRMLDNRLGTGQSTMDALMRATNRLLAGSVVVVAGYGPCGRGVAARARGMGANVVVTEVDPLRALDATFEGYRVMPMAEAATIGDFFVTVTGNRDVIGPEHVQVMRDGAVLANSGHFDVEIDVRWLRANARRHAGVRPEVDEYLLPNGRRILLIAEGRLANLGAAEGHPASVMDLSFADQALSAAWLADRRGQLSPGVHPVPEDIDILVATLKLATMGLDLDRLTSEQETYRVSWQTPGA